MRLVYPGGPCNYRDVRPERIRGLLLLAASIVCEVGGTLLLHAAQGFTVLLPSLGVLTGYTTSIVLFSRALRYGLTLGIAYGTLTGCGLVVATVSSALLFGDPLAAAQGVGLVLILLGALAMQLGPRSTTGPS
ncbi:DMT family transporter [Actinomycetospora termitidis]|uniref:SMR family transporter n=1 Tax=Actinomycetospora termitidis TaxID=3053470 RepID=A0ABT7MKF5_9PSEU|nr:SMR family transporter [Actinomycetospora sp. Odt1-22]MDL5159838.1 SMR family transporter [Actinomycetospora sp. Odt1-22]